MKTMKALQFDDALVDLALKLVCALASDEANSIKIVNMETCKAILAAMAANPKKDELQRDGLLAISKVVVNNETAASVAQQGVIEAVIAGEHLTWSFCRSS